LAGVFARLAFPAPQLIIVALVAAAIVAATVIRPVRGWVVVLFRRINAR